MHGFGNPLDGTKDYLSHLSEGVLKIGDAEFVQDTRQEEL